MSQQLQTVIALYHQRRLREADGAARRIVEADPRNIGAMNVLGAICNDVGRYDLAIQWFQRILAIDDTQAGVLNNLGESYRRLGDSARAVECFQAALGRDPTDAFAANNLALVLDGLGRVDEA